MRRANRRLPRRLRAQGGFTMILALLVLMVTSLLSAAIFLAVNSDAPLTRADLNSKRAYTAAQAGVQQYLYALGVNPTTSTWWQTCANDMTNGTGAAIAVPGATYGETYAYTPVLANGAASCANATPATLIDSTTGTLRMKVTGYAGTSSKTIIASLRQATPLSFLWYTVHETLDPAVVSGNPAGCNTFYWQGTPPTACQTGAQWITGDQVNGPLYTQDQLNIAQGASPTFGRSGSTDAVVSAQAASSSVCFQGTKPSPPCQSAAISQAVVNPPQSVPLPTDNSRLLSDAGTHVYPGTTTLTLSVSAGRTLANGWTCTSSSASSCTAITNLDMTTSPIFYASNSGVCPGTYTPTSVTYTTVTGTPTGRYYGPCGDVYVTGTYATPVTIAAADDVIVSGTGVINSTDTAPTGTASPTGTATLGLVANAWVRVMHTCTANPNVTIDGAIVALKQSFYVDNDACGGTALGTLTVHGSIAQEYHGIIGTVGSGGYLKNYNYDDRLGLVLPPYLFDIQSTQWSVLRETLCSQAGTAGACSNAAS